MRSTLLRDSYIYREFGNGFQVRQILRLLVPKQTDLKATRGFEGRPRCTRLLETPEQLHHDFIGTLIESQKTVVNSRQVGSNAFDFQTMSASGTARLATSDYPKREHHHYDDKSVLQDVHVYLPRPLPPQEPTSGYWVMYKKSSF